MEKAVAIYIIVLYIILLSIIIFIILFIDYIQRITFKYEIKIKNKLIKFKKSIDKTIIKFNKSFYILEFSININAVLYSITSL